ncbi:DUF2065 domain-containing protein [Rhodalgimonas zhirmunskyi]|uniref:DUF2065 domain-containing protein n=1 Tax=Rhodalgimonas zhirmunskyi TaxID=2964767 RepID=A0AAJ1X654_9RHOB|nr:DUF2065 domain-containing protein [Rhodoalgimonas zhirmunskyi]MDQ2094834.1 DUF2065 domain-containing protein [Rhodoalgimonas zhirmunskyi]
MILAVTLLALGLVLMIEGLVYALAPRLVEQMLEALRQMPPEARRLMGVLAMVIGLVLVWLAKALGA